MTLTLPSCFNATTYEDSFELLVLTVANGLATNWLEAREHLVVVDIRGGRCLCGQEEVLDPAPVPPIPVDAQCWRILSGGRGMSATIARRGYRQIHPVTDSNIGPGPALALGAAGFAEYSLV